MNKKRRLEKILDMLKIDGTITIKEIIDELQKSFTFYNLLIKRSYFIFVLYKI
ncbi:hypothetical protein EfmAA96_29940 (plasmid) [Enterococcus faecium]|nr:hypothetical protein EfmAA96_29940 [Enterococcus faecium]